MLSVRDAGKQTVRHGARAAVCESECAVHARACRAPACGSPGPKCTRKKRNNERGAKNLKGGAKYLILDQTISFIFSVSVLGSVARVAVGTPRA